MPKFRVTLLQKVLEWNTVDIEAPDEETARSAAIERADEQGGWECYEVLNSWVDNVKKLED